VQVPRERKGRRPRGRRKKKTKRREKTIGRSKCLNKLCTVENLSVRKTKKYNVVGKKKWENSDFPPVVRKK